MEEEPAVAWNGSRYLVTWTDTRNSGNSWDIYGARLTADGQVLDPAGIAISANPGAQQDSAVAWEGQNFLVAWDDDRGGSNANDIYAGRVSSNGVVLDPAGIPVATPSHYQWAASVSSDGNTGLVVWSSYYESGGHAVFGARIAHDGTVLDPNGFPIATVDEAQRVPAIVWGGSNYFVAWEDFRDPLEDSDIFGARVNADGSVVDPDGIDLSLTPNPQVEGSVAWDSARTISSSGRTTEPAFINQTSMRPGSRRPGRCSMEGAFRLPPRSTGRGHRTWRGTARPSSSSGIAGFTTRAPGSTRRG